MKQPELSAAGAGLVSVSTSQTLTVLELEKDAMRLSRLRKNVGVAAKLMAQGAPRRGKCVMVTLTYARAGEWSAKHVSAYMDAVQKWHVRLTGKRVPYLWIAENQEERQAKYGDAVLHYHVLFWLAPGVTMPKADKRGWWPHGMTKTEAVRSVGGSIAYVMKYVSKFESKGSFPHGARIYGVGGLDAAARSIRRWINWPAFVQSRASINERYARQVGGGWVNRDTGEWFASEWQPAPFWRVGCRYLERVRDHGRPMGACGPFNWIHEKPGGVAAPGLLH